LRQGRHSINRILPDGRIEEVNPVNPATAAALERIAEAKYRDECAYFDLLAKICQDQPFDSAELGRLKAALGKTDEQLQEDVADRAAMLIDEAEAQRVEREKVELQQLIEAQETRRQGAIAERTSTYEVWQTLDREIEHEHAKVATRQKAARAEALQKNRAATATIKETDVAIQDLQTRLQNLRPKGSAMERLQSDRWTTIHRKRSEESDRAMAPYVFAQQSEELPLDRLRAAINPPAPTQPTILDAASGPQVVRMGQRDGEEVTIAVGKLG
jgi:hypothetical protein